MKQESLITKFNKILKQYEIYSSLKEVKNKTREYYRFWYIFNRTMFFLGNRTRYILEKTFFKVDYKFWWLQVYSKTSFYRYRRIAVNSFVYIFITMDENFEDIFNTDRKRGIFKSGEFNF